MLDLNDLYYFVRVIDHGGFAPTSRHLGIPKSTLSKRMAVLEDRLGVRLVHRTSRSFVVTEAGRDFYRHAAAALIEAEAAQEVVRGRLAEPSGTVRVSASIPTAQMSLARLLPEVAAAHPRIQVILEVADRFVDIAQEGIDIALRDHFAALPDSGLIQRRVGFDPTCLVAAEAYLTTHGMPLAPDDLAQHHGLLTAPAATTWLLRHERSGSVEVSPIPRFTANETTVLLGAADAGLGIACLPSRLCRASIESGSLVRVLPEWIAGGVTTTLLMPYRRGQLPSVRAVADFLIDRLSGANEDRWAG